jgi:hypothetical protein
MPSLARITERLGSTSSKVLLTQVLVFVQTATRLKRHILAVCESKHLPDTTPDLLPDGPCKLLAMMCGMEEKDVELLWDVLGDLIWKPDIYLSKLETDETLDKAFTAVKHPAFRAFSSSQF